MRLIEQRRKGHRLLVQRVIQVHQARMVNAKVAGMDRLHLPDWRWVPRTVNVHILLAYPNADFLRHVGISPGEYCVLTYSDKDLQRRKVGS